MAHLKKQQKKTTLFCLFHRSNLYKGVSSALPELSTLRVDEVYHDVPSDVAPLITTMAMDINVPLVDSAFGKVQEVCYPIICQQKEFQKPVPTQVLLLPHSCHFRVTGWDPLPALLSALNISSTT